MTGQSPYVASPDRLQQIAYGPFLRFGRYTPPATYGGEASWTGSILYICRETTTQEAPPKCRLIDEEVPTLLDGYMLDQYKLWQFWRFDLVFTLPHYEREITYQLQLGGESLEEWSFTVPGAAQDWRWTAYSCSGFSHEVDDTKFMIDDDHPLVAHLLKKHEEQALHLAFGGGDQLYNDDVFRQPRIHQWLSIPNRADRHNAVFAEDLEDEANDYFFVHYCEHFLAPSLRKMMAMIPNVMLWDDHDIFDGWGSYPEDLLNAPVFSGIFRVARRFYLLFQQHTTLQLHEDGNSDLFGGASERGPSFSFLKLVGPTVALLGVDIRAERTKERILTDGSWKMVFDKVYQLPNTVRHLIVNFTVPILYPRVPYSEWLLEMMSRMTKLAAINAILVKTNILSSLVSFQYDEPELLDDLVDHWTSECHREERRKVVEYFQQLANINRIRVTFLSGDVHCAALGRFYSHPKRPDLASDPNFMPQIITSAIINAPPPYVAINLMHTFNVAANRINRGTREKMVRFFKVKYPSEQKVLPKRNFLLVEGHEQHSLKATIYVEDGDMTLDPTPFEVYIPQLPGSGRPSTDTARGTSHPQLVRAPHITRSFDSSAESTPEGSPR